MKAIDHDGLFLCDLQAKAFELSVESVDASSSIFVRRFMNSELAKLLDNRGILSTNLMPSDFIELIEEQYGPSAYGSEKYTHNEMHWMGYIYRYFSYIYERSSAWVYRKVKPKDLRGLYLPYHTLDPAQAVERIVEAKRLGPELELDIMYQYEVFRKVKAGE